MTKKTEKHIKLKILPLLITLLLITLIIVGVYFLTLIPIKNIYITGNNYLTDQEIIELAEIENYPSFLKTTSSKIKKRLKNNMKLTDSVSTQCYKDNDQLKTMWKTSYDVYYKKIKNAVETTKNQAIYYQEDYIDAVYHSTSNGKTEDAMYVWGNSSPYLKSVDSSWDKDSTSYLKEVKKDLSTVLDILGIDINDTSFELLSRDNSGRVEKIRFGSREFTGVEFRNLLGLRSADFDLKEVDNTLVITTRGYGHGVGLSQYGASGMAKAGYNYIEILKHYSTGVSIY